MAIRINFNPMSVRAHASLNRADRAMGMVLDQMSSGIRLRRSADDPAAMVVANAVRYHRTGVDRAVANAEDGVNMLQTAEGGMDQLSGILIKLRSLALAAANVGVQDRTQLQALQAELDNGIGSITRIAEQTSFTGVNLLAGGLAGNTLSDDAREVYSELANDWTKIPGGVVEGSTVTMAWAAGSDLQRDSVGVTLTSGALPAAADAALLGLNQNGVASLANPGSVTVTGALGSTTIAITATTTIQDLVSSINSSSSVIGAIAAYDATTGKLTVESSSFGPGNLQITSTAMDGGTVGLLDSDTATVANTFLTPAATRTIDLTYDYDKGPPTLSRTVTLTQDATSPGGRTFRNLLGGPELVAPFTGFDPGAFSLTARDTSDGQIGAEIRAPGIAHTATRSSPVVLQVGPAASQRVVLEISDLRAGALGRGAGLANLGLGSLQDLVDARTLVDGDPQQALALIDAAIDEVGLARGRSGALQANTVERVQDSLRVNAEALTAFESSLRDVDMAKESAEYARVQVMLQAATAMLAQANQVPQTVLQLLK